MNVQRTAMTVTVMQHALILKEHGRVLVMLAIQEMVLIVQILMSVLKA
jgi:hypothetical protein